MEEEVCEIVFRPCVTLTGSDSSVYDWVRRAGLDQAPCEIG